MNQNFISVDIETTSNDIRGSIISIGMVNVQTREEIYREIDLTDGFFCKPDAFEINNFTMKDLLDLKLNDRDFVDRELCRFFPSDGILMGRGISYFDLQFIRKDFPKLGDKIHRRIFDLWGFMFGIEVMEKANSGEIIQQAFDYAEQKIGRRLSPKWGPHHALYDALENVYVLEYLTQKYRRNQE